MLYDLHEKAKDSSYLDSSTPEYRLVHMIMDVAHHRLFGPPRIIDECELKKPRKFLHLKFDNKGIDAVNVNNILNHKKVQSCIPPYFKMKSTPCISHTYTSTIASKLFNYKQTLQCLDIEQFRQNPPKCSCSSSPFNYSPAGHIITGDVNIVQNEDLRSLILKGPKFREPRSFKWRQNFVSIMDSVEEYARRWAKSEGEELDTLSEWIKNIRKLLKSRIHHLSGKMRTIYPSVFKNTEVVNELRRLHDNFVLVPADKASNNIVFVCKNYYYECLLNELGFTSTSGNPTYTRTNLTKDEILQNHLSVLNTFDIPKNQDQFELPYLYWIPKLHKNPYKQRYIAGSSKCSTKPLSLLLTKLLTAIKESLQRYCSTAYSRSGVNQMWILKNSKELLENLKSHDFSKIDSIKTYDFSTLYTTIPHNKLKSRLFQIIDNCFLNKNGTRKYKFLVIGKQDTYFVRHHSDSPYKYSEADIKSMLGFLVDNIYVVFGDQVFQQSVGIPMGTNCAPLLADLFLYSYEAEFVQKLLRDNNKKLAVSFNHTFRYIDDVLSINNHNFHNYVHLIYPDELEIKDTTESDKSASYLDILLNIDSNGRLTTSLYDKRDDFDFAIVNFPFLCSNIPLSPAYGVYISQLIRYARACFAYEDFSKRGKLLTKKLMLQGYNESRLKSSFRKFYGRYNDLVCDYKLSLAHMLNDLFHTIC